MLDAGETTSVVNALADAQTSRLLALLTGARR
jgi:hypothetical protein